MKVAVLGSGRVGWVIARDLNEDANLKVTVIDRSTQSLERVSRRVGCATVVADLSNPGVVAQLSSDADLVVGALPGAMGLSTMEAVIDAGKPYVDISFMPEDPRELDSKARERGVPVLYDIGIAPGMSSMLATHAAKQIGVVRHLSILVGGLPNVRTQPWEYAAPFSPADVVEEYVRPARMRVGGHITMRPALSGIEHVDFPGIGTLEAFHTDGLRSLIDTLDCPSMEEKTLRWPGHADKIRLLRDAGFLSKESVEMPGGELVCPRDLTLKLLEEPWRLDDDSDEFTVMRVTVIGGKEPNYSRVVWNVADRSDRTRKETSMARTTGFPAAILARMMLDGSLKLEPGVNPPETVARFDGAVERLLSELDSRGVHYSRQGSSAGIPK
ncbi:MAG: saccharopine dehydrogenase NADP-binding domain-containing protein [Myxococcota bacterium]|jgi:saccharopine dehydrogenase-like NADP-dependent oxidoreductase|nr:saccharopine dehydrogenase NADP-binding domain-containing protein [Myxococcota bacterium]